MPRPRYGSSPAAARWDFLGASVSIGLLKASPFSIECAAIWAFSQLRVFADFRTSRPATVPRSHLGQRQRLQKRFAFRAVRGVAGGKEETHQKRRGGRERMDPRPTTGQKPVKTFCP